MVLPGPVKVLSLTVTSTTSGPQMEPSPASAMNSLLLIVRPLAPAAPMDTPILALPVMSIILPEMVTSAGALASWMLKVVAPPPRISKPAPVPSPSVNPVAPPIRSMPTPSTSCIVVEPLPLTDNIWRLALFTTRSSVYVPSDTRITSPGAAASMASCIVV